MHDKPQGVTITLSGYCRLLGSHNAAACTPDRSVTCNPYLQFDAFPHTWDEGMNAACDLVAELLRKVRTRLGVWPTETPQIVGDALAYMAVDMTIDVGSDAARIRLGSALDIYLENHLVWCEDGSTPCVDSATNSLNP